MNQESGQVTSVECFKCNDCENVTLSPKKLCPKCGSKAVEKTTSEGKGKVVNFATVFFPPDNYKGREPYTSVLIQLSNGCKLFGVIEGEVKDINLGSPVKVSKYDENTGGFIFELV